MALPNPTTISTSSLALTLTDIVSGATAFNRTVPPVVFKAANVQYQGNIFIPASTTVPFSPATPVASFALVYVRNLGGTGSGNMSMTINGSTVLNLDVGAVFLYASPLLSSIVITVAPGVTSINLTSAASTSANLEVLLAG